MLAIRLMQLFSDNKANFKKLTELLGLYLQIRDDYCNLRSAEVSIHSLLFHPFFFFKLNSIIFPNSVYVE